MFYIESNQEIARPFSRNWILKDFVGETICFNLSWLPHPVIDVMKYFKRFPSADGRVSISEDFRWPRCILLFANSGLSQSWDNQVCCLFVFACCTSGLFYDTIPLSKKKFWKASKWKKERLPKAQRTWGLSSAYQSNFFCHIKVIAQILIKFHLQNLDQASTSKSQPNIHKT